MDRDNVIEGQIVGDSTAIVRVDAAAPVAWTPSFAVSVDDAIARKREKHRFFREVMVADQHYGVIPGTGTKPALLKPGAEMLLANMGLQAEFVDEGFQIEDIMGNDHGGEAYIAYRRACVIYKQTGPRVEERIQVARAGGFCSSWEPKYRYRNAQRSCPECGKAAIIAGKKEYGGGFICFKKKDGCGAKFAENDTQITSQIGGKVANADIAELQNTILKMADKRALVAATLIATGCSDIFTQDIEDGALESSSAGGARQGQQSGVVQKPADHDKPITENATKHVAIESRNLGFSNDERHTLISELTGGNKSSTKNLTMGEARLLVQEMRRRSKRSEWVA